jgi:AcrR family transcriptional regulator
MARERATDTTALVAAAAEVFRVRGYHNATIDDIAEAAGISRPTVYKYTKSKQHLLDLMVDQVTQDMGRRMQAVIHSTDDPTERLRRVVRAHVEAAVANRTFYAIVLSEEVEVSDAAVSPPSSKSWSRSVCGRSGTRRRWTRSSWPTWCSPCSPRSTAGTTRQVQRPPSASPTKSSW